MPKWSGQGGQCIFCLVRSTRLAPSPRPTCHRRISVTSAVGRPAAPALKPRIRSHGSRLSRLGAQGARSDTLSFRPGLPGRLKLYGRRPSSRANQGLLPPPDPTRLVDFCLKAAEGRLRASRNDSSKEPAALALDPDGEQWKTFKKDVGQIYQGLPPDAPSYLKEIRAHVDRTLSLKDRKIHIARYLYGAFLDKSLDALDLNPTKALFKVADMRYPTEWYAQARAIQRVVHLHIGPTNSGKTYAALKRLEEADNGFYAGPLRLLAHEVYSRFNAKGQTCDLITGDDVRVQGDGPAPKFASTVEMVDTGRDVEVGVIDEIQMISDESRGWAWTRALLGCRAKELHVCGESRVLPLMRELIASTGDKLKVHNYERLNPLKVMSRSLRGSFKNLRKGDAIVCFSIMNIHALKKQIEHETSKRVAVVYGSLPPEIRAQQAALFNDPANDYDYLVASDAIGMGLNLSIKRIIFETVHKFDGMAQVQLSIPQIKQIAGRAGRFRTAHDDLKRSRNSQPTRRDPDEIVGLVTSLEEEDLPIIQEALSVEAPPLRKASIIPPADFMVEYAARLPDGVAFGYVMSRLCEAAVVHPRFALGSISGNLQIAESIERVRKLSTTERCVITACPASWRSGETYMPNVLQTLAAKIANKEEVRLPDISEIPLEVLEESVTPDQAYLGRLERLHQCLTVYIWLSYRFSSILCDQDVAFYAKELTEQRINDYLTRYSANKRLSRRVPVTSGQPKGTAPSHSKAVGGVSTKGLSSEGRQGSTTPSLKDEATHSAGSGLSVAAQERDVGGEDIVEPSNGQRSMEQQSEAENFTESVFSATSNTEASSDAPPAASESDSEKETESWGADSADSQPHPPSTSQTAVPAGDHKPGHAQQSVATNTIPHDDRVYKPELNMYL